MQDSSQSNKCKIVGGATEENRFVQLVIDSLQSLKWWTWGHTSK